MTAAPEQKVTYTGKETPFVDRIYRSRLTFNPGQTRALPVLLAAKLLRHADVFEVYVEPAPAPLPVQVPATPPQDAPAAQTPPSIETVLASVPAQAPETLAQPPAAPVVEQTQPVDLVPVQEDDTAAQLEAAKKAEDEQRQQEDVRFTLLQQVDKMDKQALRDWVKQTYKQELPGNLGLDKMRDRARGFIDQFGAL